MCHRAGCQVARRLPRIEDRPSRIAKVMAKAQGRFAKADKQRASIKADPKKATQREQERVEHVKRAKKAPKRS
jgi:hypothetical protein